MQVLRSAGLPDCAHAYVCACREAGLVIPQQQQPAQQVSGGSSNTAAGQNSTSYSGADDDVDAVFGSSKQESPEQCELFDILAMRRRSLLPTSQVAGGEASGAELLALIKSEYQQYLCDLVKSL